MSMKNFLEESQLPIINRPQEPRFESKFKN